MKVRTLGFVVAAVLVSTVLSGCFRPAASASNDLASAEKYTKLIVEIDYATGKQPRQASVDLLKTRIQERLSKPEGVEVVQAPFSSSRTSYSNDDLRDLESDQRTHAPGGKTMVLYVLFVNGGHASDSANEKVLGVQYGRASIAIFRDSVDNSGGILGLGLNVAQVEQAVLIHEFGHALGLVNNGLAMVSDHEDKEHPKHSDNEGSVMYWAVENTFGIGALDRIPNDFDADDIADIRAAGGK